MSSPLNKRRSGWIGIGGTVMVVAVAAFLYVNHARTDTDVVPAVRRDVVQTVVASGRVVTPFRVDIGSQVVGKVIEVPVAEGQVVRAGQTLVELESSEARAALRQADVAVAQAEARLRQLRELQLPVADQSLRQAQANLANAKAQYERTKRLHESGFVGKAALDDAQRTLEVNQTQVDSAQKQVDTAKPTGSDYAVALAALEQARANQQAARARLSYATLQAPSDGTLIARDVERGDVVQPGKVLMVLSPAGETQIVLQIDERNLSRIRPGQQALASADAFPGLRFGAELAYINPGIDAQRGTVEVKLRVPKPPDYLKQDMTVSVDIEVERRPSAIAVPTGTLRDAGGAAPWVLVLTDGHAVRRPVKVGLKGEGWVEILAGVSEGELLVPASNTRVKPGQRMRASAGA